MFRLGILLAGLGTAVSALAQTGPVVPPSSTTPRPAAQAQYDQLVALVDAAKMAEAVTAADALEARVKATKSPNQAVLASIALLKARALVKMDRSDEVSVILTQLLQEDRFGTPSQAPEHYTAAMLLASLNEKQLDLGLAAARYRLALRVAEPGEAQLPPLAGIARSLSTVEPAKAIEAADQALALLAPGKDEQARRAAYLNLRGRALLNAGNAAEALAVLRKSVAQNGGLTLKTTRADVAARADAALAAFVANRPDVARELLAMTGAGRMKGTNFELGKYMRTPQCGGTDGLKPADVAVIEFSLTDDGRVVNMLPIYANRAGPVAIAFARAIEEWRWDPKQAMAIDGFFRQGTRLQMRCTNAIDRPDVMDLLAGDLAAWYDRQILPPNALTPHGPVVGLAALKARLGENETALGVGSVALMPILLMMASNAETTARDAQTYGERALSIAMKAGAPPLVSTYLKLKNASVLSSKDLDNRRGFRRTIERLSSIGTDQIVTGDAKSFAAYQLFLARTYAQTLRFDDAMIITRRAAQTAAGLAANDPIRVAALVRLASAEQAAGDTVAAKTAFENSGLSARQCALADAKPPRVGGSTGAENYPAAALIWGFSGWVVTEFDITANGESTNNRALITYPPYVFAGAATGMTKSFRFRKTFRPDGGLSCGANIERISFTGFVD